jgi:hypothetical protein
MKALVSRLTSRKFLLAVSAVAALVAAHQFNQAVVVALGYFGVNIADVKAAAPTTPQG